MVATSEASSVPERPPIKGTRSSVGDASSRRPAKSARMLSSTSASSSATSRPTAVAGVGSSGSGSSSHRPAALGSTHRRVLPPSVLYPILQTYIDVVLSGCLEHGEAFAREGRC